MSVTGDILRFYRQPRQVVRRHLAAGPREDRALAFLMGACALIFLAQWPALVRAAHFDPSVPLEARIGGAMLAMLFMLPLLCYGLAAVVHLVARLIGGRGSWYSARLALFWSLLAISPLMLVQGLLSGMIGTGPLLTGFGLMVLGAFLTLWGAAMIETETGQTA